MLLAIGAAKRMLSLPQIPTLIEEGYNDITGSSLLGPY